MKLYLEHSVCNVQSVTWLMVCQILTSRFLLNSANIYKLSFPELQIYGEYISTFYKPFELTVYYPRRCTIFDKVKMPQLILIDSILNSHGIRVRLEVT
jgi:hypothetical protein